MPDPMDMYLNETIRNRNKKKSMGARRGKGSGAGPGTTRRFGKRDLLRTTPYSVAPALQVREPAWKQKMFTDGVPTTETGTKLYISNLEYGVSKDDIKVLFSEVGQLKRYSVHDDKSGSIHLGALEVVFLHQADALASIKRYNNVKLDGKPLKIDLIGATILTPAVVQPTTKGMMGKPKGFFKSVGYMGAAKRRVLIRNRKLGLGGGRGGGQSEKILLQILILI